MGGEEPCYWDVWMSNHHVQESAWLRQVQGRVLQEQPRYLRAQGRPSSSVAGGLLQGEHRRMQRVQRQSQRGGVLQEEPARAWLREVQNLLHCKQRRVQCLCSWLDRGAVLREEPSDSRMREVQELLLGTQCQVSLLCS